MKLFAIFTPRFMGLPIYKAIGFQVILDKGGHSKPWVVIVNADGSPKPYVVKLYKHIEIEARNRMTAEVLGNVMATEFGLTAPQDRKSTRLNSSH